MSDWTIEDSMNLYQVNKWSDGYYSINEKGNICINPHGEDANLQIDMQDVIEEMKNNKIEFPAVIRFHDILRSRVKNLNKLFAHYISEYKFNGNFCGVYPIKVNQLREVVEEIIDAGSEFNYGIEAGSKSELLAALAMNTNEDSITILNGYKDEEYLRLALLGMKMGRKVIVVIEKYSELASLLKLSNEMNIEPIIGFRVKLKTKSAGKWADSSGERAKFGLSIQDIVNGWELLKAEGKQECLKLLHFHMGSQIPDIRNIKESITEGARVFAKLSKLGANIEYFDVGGGAGIDYDGSKSQSNSSINYSIKDYVSDVVYILKEVCDLENVKHPNIVTESGRAITAHHSCFVTNVFGKVDFKPHISMEASEGENALVKQMRVILDSSKESNYRESYYDAITKKDECHNAFKLGILSLDEMAKIESLFWGICHRIKDIVKEKDDRDSVPEEIQHLEKLLSEIYLCNFSVFQSVPDSWAIGQVIPIMPLQNLNIEPTNDCTLVDITCDSDGRIKEYIGPDGQLSSTIKLHPINKNEEYTIGFFLTGAYQDIMGDMHNLFGRLSEAHVFADAEEDNNFYIEEIIKGQRSKDVLKIMQYNSEILATTIKQNIDKRVRTGFLKPREGVRLVDFYEDCLENLTYLCKSKS